MRALLLIYSSIIVVGCLAVVVSTQFREQIIAAWPDYLATLLIVLFSVAFGGLLSFVAGWRVVSASQERMREGLLTALLTDSAQNRAIMIGAIRDERWGKRRMNTSPPSLSGAEAVIAEASFFRVRPELMGWVFFYKNQIEAVRLTMDVMTGQFLNKGGCLSKGNLIAIDRMCRNGVAAVTVLQQFMETPDWSFADASRRNVELRAELEETLTRPDSGDTETHSE